MFVQTVRLIHRVSNLFGQHREFFDAVAQWYDDVKLARKAIRALVRIADGREVRMTVNGRRLDPVRAEGALWDRIPSWEIPSNLLVSGDNEIRITPSERESAGLLLRTATVYQDGPLQAREVSLTDRDPTYHREFHLASSSRAGPRHDCWKVAADGALVFRVRPLGTAQVVFSLEFAGDDILDGELRDIAEDVFERVLKKRKELLARIRNARGEREDWIDEALRDLDAFADLYEDQIRHALSGADRKTLEAVIQSTGNPDAIVQRRLSPRRTNSHPAKAASRAAHSPTASTAAPAKAVAAAKGAGGFKVLLCLSVVLAAPVAYIGWGDKELRDKVVAWFDKVTGRKSAPTGNVDVMQALRNSTDELGWKRNAEKIQDIEEERRALSNGKSFQHAVKMHFVGEAGSGSPNASGKALEYMSWKRVLSVFDAGTEAAADKFWENMLNDCRVRGYQVTDFGAVGTKRALLRQTGPDAAGYAQLGRYILYTRGSLAAGTETVEARRRFEVLAYKLDSSGDRESEAKPNTENRRTEPIPDDERRKGVLGIPVPGAKDEGFHN